MEKVIIIGLFLILFDLTCEGQHIYSQQNLEQASNEELTNYMTKAKKLRKTGKFLSIGGPISAATGLVMFSASWSGGFGGSFTAGAGLTMFLVGIGGTIVGLPILITGVSRISKIEKIMANTSKKVFIEIAPYDSQYDIVQNNQAGITLRIRF